jgi:hypothetical protein
MTFLVIQLLITPKKSKITVVFGFNFSQLDFVVMTLLPCVSRLLLEKTGTMFSLAV